MTGLIRFEVQTHSILLRNILIWVGHGSACLYHSTWEAEIGGTLCVKVSCTPGYRVKSCLKRNATHTHITYTHILLYTHTHVFIHT